MAHWFTFQVTVEVERISGKFATREEISEPIMAELESAASGADVSGLGPDGDSEYEITDYNVNEL
jgi:hypothetical protein